MQIVTQDKDAIRHYWLDFSKVLSGNLFVTGVEIDPDAELDGLVVSYQSVNSIEVEDEEGNLYRPGVLAGVIISGGTPGTIYNVLVRITLNSSERDDRSFSVKIIDSQNLLSSRRQLNIYPIIRSVAWDQDQTPELVIGDSFAHLATLIHSESKTPFDISAAASVKVAVVMSDHSKALTSSIDMSSSDAGADFADGVVAVVISPAVTQEASNHIDRQIMAKIEIQVTINNNIFSWFAPVRLIPGYI